MNNKIQQTENGDDLDYTGTQEEFDYTKQNTEAVQSDSIKKEDVHENQEEVEALEEVVVVPEETEHTTSEDIIEEQIVTDMPTLSFSEDETLEVVKSYGLSPLFIQRLEDSKHIFTHKEWHMRGYAIRVEELEEETDGMLFVERETAER